MIIHHTPNFHFDIFKNRIERSFSQMLVSVLGLILNDTRKRLVFVASLMAVVTDIKEPNKDMVKRLNQIFDISKFDNAIPLSMWFGNKIWSHKTKVITSSLPPMMVTKIDDILCKTFNPAEARLIANIIILNTPKWLNYGSKRVMREDIMKLISLSPKICNI
jgi:hypothetical protein